MAITILTVPGDDGRDLMTDDAGGLPWLVWDEDRPSGTKG